MVYDLAHWEEPRNVIGWDLTENQYQLEGVAYAIDIVRSLNLSWKEMAQSTILDFGCGTGRVARPLSLMFREAWAYDPQRNCILVALKECRSTQANGGSIALGNLFYTSQLPKKKFDYVCSTGVMEHLDEELQTKTMKEIFGCLKENGRALIRWSPWNNHRIVEMLGYVHEKNEPRIFQGVYRHEDITLLQKKG